MVFLVRVPGAAREHLIRQVVAILEQPQVAAEAMENSPAFQDC